MRKTLSFIVCLVSALVFFSCQTAKIKETAEDSPSSALEQDIQKESSVKENQDSPLDSSSSIQTEKLITPDEKQEEFLSVQTQDIQPINSASDEFLPVTEEGLIIELSPRKEEKEEKIVRPILRPRTASETAASAKIWGSEDAREEIKADQTVEELNEDQSASSLEPAAVGNTTEPVKPLMTEVIQQQTPQSLAVLQEAEQNTLPQNSIIQAPSEKKQEEGQKQMPEQNQMPEQISDPLISSVSEDSIEQEILPSVSAFIPSRTVEVKNNQYIDVTYPGNGWVYIGEEGSTSLLTYFGRKTDKGNTVFTLRTKESGKTLLHFYKVDALSGSYIDDYLEVVIDDDSAALHERFEVPPYQMSNALTPPSPSVQTNESSPKTLPSPDPSWTSAVATEPDVQIIFPDESEASILYEGIPSSQLLIDAKNAFNNAEYKKALNILDEFLKISTSSLDEAWWMRGQIYEMPSDQRNIRKALESYETLTKAYPSSPLWKQAKDRITYLEKFYFTIN